MADKGYSLSEMNWQLLEDVLFYHTSSQVKGRFLKRRQSIKRKLPVSGFMWSDIWKDLKTGTSSTAQFLFH